MRTFFLAIVLLLSTTCAFAQEEPSSSKYFGFNANPLLAQVLPFNSINGNTFNASIMNRMYNKKNAGIRFGFGVGIDQNNDVNNLFFSIDQDRRRSIHPRWMFFYGFGGALKFINADLFDNAIVSTSSAVNQFSVSMGAHWGIEYKINSILSVSTEATLILGLKVGNDGGVNPLFRLDPPINIMAHFNIFNKNKKK